MYNDSNLGREGFRPEVKERMQRDLASLFRYDAQAERMIRMRESNPAGFDALSAGLKMGLGYYESQKAAATACGIDTTGGAQ